MRSLEHWLPILYLRLAHEGSIVSYVTMASCVRPIVVVSEEIHHLLDFLLEIIVVLALVTDRKSRHPGLQGVVILRK
jgi:hypothetical protein